MPSISITWFLDLVDPTLPPAPLEIPALENYTATEITAAVDKLVQGAIRRPYGILGERKTLDAFDDTMDAAAGVFILTPEAPFYVVQLGTRRLNDTVTGVVTDAASLYEAISNTGRRVRPLESVTSLGNARTALLALEGAGASRSSAFEDITQTPAFQRFDRHTSRFLDDSANAIKVGTEIVQTPVQARKSLGSLVSTVTAAFQDAQRRVGLLYAGIDDFNALNLPALLAQGVITKTRTVLEERITQLETLTPSQRLEFLRETVLDVLAGKAVVRGFGSLSRSGTFVLIEGEGVPFADADHPGTAALVQSTIGDPYSILTGGDELTFLVDGGPDTTTIPVQKSFIAKVEGVVAEPFEITGTNDTLLIGVTGFSNLSVTLTTGAARTIAQICTNINAAIGIGGQPLIAEPYFNPEKFSGVVNAINASGPNIDFVSTSGDWEDLNVVPGDQILITSGAMTGSLFDVDVVAGDTIECTLFSGSASNATGITALVGPAARFLRIRISDAGALNAVDTSRSISILSTSDDAAATLGLVTGIVVTSRRTRADEIASSINSSANSSIAGVARVEAEAVFIEVDPLNGRCDPNDSTKIISTLFRATGTITVGGTNASLTLAGAQTAGVELFTRATIRSSPTAADVGAFGYVAFVSDFNVNITFTTSVTVGAVEVEFGQSLGLSDLVPPARDTVIRIASPSPVAGDYRTLSPLDNPMEARIDRPLPITSTTGGQGLSFSIQVSQFRVDFRSLSTLTDSELSISGSAQGKFFTSPPGTGVGSTPFVLLASDPKVLGAGDVLELYSGQYNEPELSFSIIGFERGQQLLELDGGVPNGFSPLDFSLDIEVPFARIRKVQRNNYDDLKVQLGLWLALPVNDANYFSELNRLLNPVIVNTNPTLAAVNSAKLHVQSLVQALQQLQTVLLSYQVDTVPQVDTLIDSFLSRGSDRAVDTLLEGRFTEFFGYNSEEVSYLGNALERLRDVSRLDLPVRRTARKEVIDQELSLGEFEEPDFEFDQSDTQDISEPDIPGQFVEVPGSNF